MQTLPDVVHAAARQFGNLEAVVEGPARPTFADVETAVAARARALVASGTEPGDRVGLWAPNGLEWIVLSFAVYATGAVLVPVNTRFKGDEAAYVLRQTGVRRLFTVTDFLDTDYVSLLDGSDLPDLDEIVVMAGPTPPGATAWATFVDRATSASIADVAAREARLRATDVCDVIFTSGTTGRPKGAELTHGASIETYRQWADRVGLRPGDRELIVYPFFHTSGLKSGVLAAFLTGVTLVPHAVFDVESVLRVVAEERITFLPGPPSVFQSILSHPDAGRFDLRTLRLSVTGAATVPVELVERMRSELRLESVVTAYGLTETHGTATVCRRTDPAATIARTVGTALDGVELRIVDDDGVDVEPGRTGEVWIAGFNVIRGYIADPAATEAAIADGWLRTGDIGYLEPDGHLHLVDRKKDVFIVGGFNVAPAEVERVLLRRDDVAQVAVVAVPDERLGEVGVAFVVARPGCTVEPADVVAWCRDRMANYKVPRYVHLVAALPVNASGKVQKAALRDQLRGERPWIST
ncbi:MAG TPA: AMP-binding protein [Acidimicrobiales bacterium]